MGCIYAETGPKNAHFFVHGPQARQKTLSEPLLFTPARCNNPVYACFLVKVTSLIKKISLNKYTVRLFSTIVPFSSSTHDLESKPKRCSLVMCLWKLELGSVHSLFNLWEKNVLTTIKRQLQSFLFPGPFSVELECSSSSSGLFYLEDIMLQVLWKGGSKTEISMQEVHEGILKIYGCGREGKDEGLGRRKSQASAVSTASS